MCTDFSVGWNAIVDRSGATCYTEVTLKNKKSINCYKGPKLPANCSTKLISQFLSVLYLQLAYNFVILHWGIRLLKSATPNLVP